MFFYSEPLIFIIQVLCLYKIANSFYKGLYIKYKGRKEGGEGGQRVFVGVMKYFKHILMGHEIFFKIFGGPQNYFLCSIFVILFFKLKGLQHKISKLAIKEI